MNQQHQNHNRDAKFCIDAEHLKVGCDLELTVIDGLTSMTLKTVQLNHFLGFLILYYKSLINRLGFMKLIEKVPSLIHGLLFCLFC